MPATLQRHWPVLLCAALVALGFVVSLALCLQEPHYPVAGDAHYSFAAARSMAYDGDLDLGNQYAVMGDRWSLRRHRGADGVELPPRELGPSLLMVPGLWAHHLLGLPTWLEAWMAVLPATAALGVFVFVFAFHARTPANDRAEVHVVLAAGVALASCLPFYALGRAGYAHAPDAVVAAALALSLVRAGEHVSPRRSIVCGSLFALAILVRLQNALFILWPLATILFGLVPARQRKRTLGLVAAMVLLGSLGALPQIVGAALHPGSPYGPFRWGPAFFDLRDLARDLFTVIGGRHGFFSITPIAAVGVGGLVLGARDPRWRPHCIPALVVLTAMVVLMATVRDPSGGTAYGARRLCGMTGLIAVGSSAAWQLGPPDARRALGVGVGIAVVANLILTAAALGGITSLD